MEKKVHIGNLIAKRLEELHVTQTNLSYKVGLKPSTGRSITKREVLDTVLLQKISIALGVDFFKYYPVTGVANAEGAGEKEKEIEKIKNESEVEKKKLLEKITALEKELENCKRDLVLKGQENGYLKEINELLKKR